MAPRFAHVLASVFVLSSILLNNAPSLGADLATWTLNGILNSANPVPVTATVPNVTAGSLAKSAALGPSSFVDAFVATGWPLAGTPDNSRYLEFSVSPGAGYGITYDDVVFSLGNNHFGTSKWEIRSSLDGFTTAMDRDSVTQLVGAGTPVFADVSDLGSWTGPVTFRVYTYGNTGDNSPDQRGFRGSASGGQNLRVRGSVFTASGTPGIPTGAAFRLDPIRPNPVRHSALIHFSIPSSERVELAIFDMQGRLVRTVFKGDRSAGEHSARWDGQTEDGAAARPGVYFASLKAGTYRASQSVILVQ